MAGSTKAGPAAQEQGQLHRSMASCTGAKPAAQEHGRLHKSRASCTRAGPAAQEQGQLHRSRIGCTEAGPAAQKQPQGFKKRIIICGGRRWWIGGVRQVRVGCRETGQTLNSFGYGSLSPVKSSSSERNIIQRNRSNKNQN